MTPPRVFISYAWGDEDAWVEEFATRLRADGVDARLDRWELHPGDEIAVFMEEQVRESAFVLFICTPRFKAKADERKGGVGYEAMIATAEVMAKREDVRRKFVPVHRSGDWVDAAASWLLGKYLIDLRGDPYLEANYQDLRGTLLGRRRGAPPVGTPASSRVLVLGSGSDLLGDADDPKTNTIPDVNGDFVAACRALGAAMGRAGCITLVHSGNDATADRWVVEGLKEHGNASGTFPTVEVHRPLRIELNRDNFAGDDLLGIFILRRAYDDTEHWQVALSRTARSADVVLVLGGGCLTEAAAQLASDAGTPVLGVASLGGAGARWGRDAASRLGGLVPFGDLAPAVAVPWAPWLAEGIVAAAMAIAESPRRTPKQDPVAYSGTRGMGQHRAEPVRHTVTGAARLALEHLLLDLFSLSELRRFVAYQPDGDDLVANLPSGGSPAEYVHDLVALLQRRGHVNGELFDAIIAERPGRSADVATVRRQFGL